MRKKVEGGGVYNTAEPSHTQRAHSTITIKKRTNHAEIAFRKHHKSTGCSELTTHQIGLEMWRMPTSTFRRLNELSLPALCGGVQATP
jgi:hypothetical protein